MTKVDELPLPFTLKGTYHILKRLVSSCFHMPISSFCAECTEISVMVLTEINWS